jgi:hypothetical protein
MKRNSKSESRAKLKDSKMSFLPELTQNESFFFLEAPLIAEKQNDSNRMKKNKINKSLRAQNEDDI